MLFNDRRYIEVSFPVKEVSIESSKEKSIRRGHISTMHVWWSRKPLGASRATNYASLVLFPNTAEKIEKMRVFITYMSKWKNQHNPVILRKARKEIIDTHGSRPRVLDPFAGGGSIPLEALRLGCETHAMDYNPVASILLKCTLEYPLRWGVSKSETPLRGKFPIRLIEDIKKWGRWVYEETKKEIGRFYPSDPDGSIPIGYYWVWSVPCQNPSCGATIPLLRQYWFVNTDNKKIVFYPIIKGKKIDITLLTNNIPKDFDPSTGIIYNGRATCPACGFVIDGKTMHMLFQSGKAKPKMLAVILRHPKRGRFYRLATEKDLIIYMEAEKYLKEKRAKLSSEWGIDPVPDEPIQNFSIRDYGFYRWGDLFNARQKLSLITLIEKIRKAYTQMISAGYDKEYAKAITTYLALILDRQIDKNAILVDFIVKRETIGHVWIKPVLSIAWNYMEVNIFGNGNGDWLSNLEWVIDVLRNILLTPEIETLPIPVVKNNSATKIDYPDEYFDAVFTDPPYYDNILYSDAADFFYVILKRSIGHLYPEWFVTPLSPRRDEIVAHGKNAKKQFESKLRKAFAEIYRVLKPGGIAVIIYAHKSTSGWEALIESLLDSGLVVTASWPIETERRSRTSGKKSAILTSSIYFVCRKIKKNEIGWLKDVRNELRKYISKKLKRLWEEGISGADYFIAAIGSAIEIFGKYKKIMDYEGKVIKTAEIIDFIREIVTEHTLKMILGGNMSFSLSPLTRFYLLWRKTYGTARVHFDDARKLAQSTGVSIEKEWHRGFIRKKNGYIYVLGPHERNIKTIEKSDELIDVLHHVLLLWKKGDDEAIIKRLRNYEYGRSDVFYKVAQALSQILPQDSKEKKLIDGFLAKKDTILMKLGKIGSL